jgi:hypothetical protein
LRQKISNLFHQFVRSGKAHNHANVFELPAQSCFMVIPLWFGSREEDSRNYLIVYYESGETELQTAVGFLGSRAEIINAHVEPPEQGLPGESTEHVAISNSKLRDSLLKVFLTLGRGVTKRAILCEGSRLDPEGFLYLGLCDSSIKAKGLTAIGRAVAELIWLGGIVLQKL